jgi:hypothetical protein
VSVWSCQIKHPQADKGVLRLEMNDFKQSPIISLAGKWEFYWNTLLTPHDFKQKPPTEKHFVKVPNSWTGVTDGKSQNYPAYGYATYRLQLHLPAEEKWGLYIPKIWSATKIWINGILVLERGKIAIDYQNYENQIVEKLIALPIQNVELVIQVANHDMFIAGLVQPFWVGAYEKLYQQQETNNSFTLMWLGCLVLMAFYHFILYLYRRKNISVLYFGLACALIALRMLVFGEHYFYEYLKESTHILTFFWQSKIYYLSSFLLVPVALAYIRHLYPQDTRDIVVKICAGTLGIFCIFIALTPPRIANLMLTVGEILTVVFQLYLVYVLALATIRKREDAPLQMLGILCMIFASINDTLHGEEIELVGSIELTPIVFAVFLIMQFFIIARRFSAAFNAVEDLSQNLEKKVIARTQELNQTLQLVEQERQKSY